jgi:hypothetical protein
LSTTLTGGSDTNAGSYPVTCTINSGQSYTGSASGTFVINQAPNTVTLSGVPASAEYGYSFTAAATGLGTGAVTYSSDGVVCTNVNATYTMIGGSGACTVTATQAADTNRMSATASQGVTAVPANTSVGVQSSGSPSVYGGSVTFTAAITSDTSMVKGRDKKGHVKSHVLNGTVTWSANTGCAPSAVSGYPGTATCTTSILPVGSNDTVTASYAGDPNHTNASGNASQSVSEASSSISITSVSPSSEDFGLNAPVTITAVLSWAGGGSAPNANNVTIGGNGPSGYSATTCGAPASGTITCTATYTPTSADVAATYNETAAFADDGNYTVSSAVPATFTINQATSGVAVASSSASNTSTYGDTVTFTATISGENNFVKGRNKSHVKSHDVTGNVTWSANTGCPQSTVSGYPGVATCTTSALNAGSDTVTAAYSGDSSHQGNSGSVIQTVNKAGQTITFTTNAPANAAYNSQFTVAATASSGLTVHYHNNGTKSVCTTPSPYTSGTYTMVSGTGTCDVEATQAGNSNYNAATPVIQDVTATLANNTVTLSGVPASAEYGSSITVLATGLGTGAVTYSSDGVVCSNAGSTYTMIASTGTCTVTATQAADSDYASASASQGVSAAGAVSSVGVTSSLNPSIYGQSVTFTATITSDTSAVKGRNGKVKSHDVSGTVTWSANTGCSASTISGYPGTATCTTSTLPVGTGETITASYSGDSNHSAGSGSVSQEVDAAASNVAVSSSLNPSSYGQSVTFTATISGANGLVKGKVKSHDVSGTVTWSDNTGCGTTSVTSGNPGTATCTTSTLPVGAGATITASYSGDSNHSAGSGSVSQEVDAAGSNVSVASSVNPSAYQQAVTFTATISGANGLVKGKVKSHDVSGTVTWSGNTGCGTTSVTSGNPGTATCTTSSLPVGKSNIVTANYNGDSNHNQGSGSISQEVDALGSTTTVLSSLSPSVYGQAVSFTANVTAGATGTVQFNIDGSAFGSPVTLVSGMAASGSIATLAVGPHTVTVAYSGDSNYGSSTGTLAGGQTVTSATAGVTVTSGLNPSTYGQSVTFTAQIAGEYGNVKARNVKKHAITGTVNWSSNTLCGSTAVTTNPDGSGTATCATSILNAGSDTVTAAYSGDANHGGSSGSVIQTVNKANQTVSFTGLPSSLPYDNTYTLTATSNDPNSSATITSLTPKVCTVTGTTATIVADSGTCTVQAKWAADSNYNAAGPLQQTGTAALGVPVITWATPAAINYGTKLTTGTTGQLNATAVPSGGKFVYSPAANAILTPGQQQLGVTYTLTGKTGKEYTTANASVYLTVNPATSTTAITSADSVTLKKGTATYKAAFTVDSYKPAGSVTVNFVNTTTGATTSCTDSSIATSGKGTCSQAFTAAGTWTVTATYTPSDTYHTGSTSAPITLTVVE